MEPATALISGGLALLGTVIGGVLQHLFSRNRELAVRESELKHKTYAEAFTALTPLISLQYAYGDEYTSQQIETGMKENPKFITFHGYLYRLLPHEPSFVWRVVEEAEVKISAAYIIASSELQLEFNSILNLLADDVLLNPFGHKIAYDEFFLHLVKIKEARARALAIMRKELFLKN